MKRQSVLVCLIILFCLITGVSQADTQLPEGLVTIDDQAFMNDAELKGVLTVPDSVTTIGAEAFRGCTGITGLVLPQDMDSIKSKAFAECIGLVGEVVIPYGCEVAEDAFDGCVTLRVIPAEPTSADYFTYTIDNGEVTITGFDDTCGITDVIVPTMIEGYSVTRIGMDAFSLTKITSIVLPDSVKYIDQDAFAWCMQMLRADLGHNIIEIQDGAFSACLKLQAINIGKNATYIGNYAFSNCRALQAINLGESLIEIGDDSFYNCESLKSIYLPITLTYMEGNPFKQCESLETIEVALDHPQFEVRDGVLFNKKEKKLVCYPRTLRSEVYYVPQDTEWIGDYAFIDCETVKVVELPDKLKGIGYGAFENCCSLEKMILPDGLTELGGGTFYGCTSLSSVSLPDSLRYIFFGTFTGCESLLTLELPDNLEHIDECAFDESGLTSIRLPEGVKSIGEKAFAFCENLTSVDMPNTLTDIDEYAFYSCPNLNNVMLPESITIIKQDTFGKCTGLTQISIPTTVTQIDPTAFEGCSSDLEISCELDSYAAQYAAENRIVTWLTIPDVFLQPEEPPKSEASTEIDRLIAFGENAGMEGSELNTFLNKMLLKHTTADILADITLDKYTSGSGWIDAGIEGIIFTLTDPAEMIDKEIQADYGCRLFEEVAMDIMGGGRLPDLNAAAEINMVDIVNDATTITSSLDEMIFFNEIHLSKWDECFNYLAETYECIEINGAGDVTVIDQFAYDSLRNIFKMRKESDIESLDEMMNKMLKIWEENGKCVLDEKNLPKFTLNAECGGLPLEYDNYVAMTQMKKTAKSVQEKVKNFGDIADVIGNIADAISIVSSVSQEVNKLEIIRASYTKNRQFLYSVKKYSAGDSEKEASSLLSGLEGDFDMAKNDAVVDVIGTYGAEKVVESLTKMVDKYTKTSVLGSIMAGGKIAGMIPLVQDAKELIDCQHLIIGWSTVRWELQGALQKAMNESSPYTMYLADLYIEWHLKGLEIAQKYYTILKEHTIINNQEKVQGAYTLLSHIADELAEWNEEYSYVMWNQYYYDLP